MSTTQHSNRPSAHPCVQDHVTSVKDDLDSRTQDDDEATKIAGGSVIIDPLGTILAGPLRGSEGYVPPCLANRQGR